MNTASPCKGWLSYFALTINFLREILSCTRQIQKAAAYHKQLDAAAQPKHGPQRSC
jgi:hypothetical protein